MSKQIPLSRGLFATVDDADFDWLNQWKWSALKVGRKNAPPKFYAVRTTHDGLKQATILMHRQITGAPKGKIPDHRNLNTLDNQRHNLRVGTQSQNCLNQRGHRDRKGSRFKGVYAHQGKWCASFRSKYIGIFITEEEAARAYDVAARLHDSEFSMTNFDDAGNERPYEAPTVTIAPPRVQSSQQKGVTWNKRQQRWVVQISGKHYGVFHQEEDAISKAKLILEGHVNE